MKSQAKRKKRIKWNQIIGWGIVVLLVGYGGYSHVVSKHRASKTVVARVNGNPIYESDIIKGMPASSFNMTAEDIKRSKLMRIITAMAIEQFLDKHHVEVDESIIQEEIAKLEKTPPSLGCACCTYPSLNEYLRSNAMTREDLYNDIKRNLSLEVYAKKSWEEAHPDPAEVLKEIAAESQMIRRNYVRGWQIFFNTFQQPGDQQEIQKTASQNAKTAWERLQKGDDFETVAKEMSEDMTSKDKGGYLGFTDGSAYGREFQQALHTLKPKELSKIVQSTWGYHIIKYEPMSDADIAEFFSDHFIQREQERVTKEIMDSTKIEILLPDID